MIFLIARPQRARSWGRAASTLALLAAGACAQIPPDEATRRAAAAPAADSAPAAPLAEAAGKPPPNDAWAASTPELAAATPELAAAAPEAAAAPVEHSPLDAEGFYDVLTAEMLLREGDGQAAYQQMLAAARRTGDARVFVRAIEIGMRNQSPEQALAAAKAWRQADPRSRSALEFQARLQLGSRKEAEGVASLREWLGSAPPAERAEALQALPRLVSSMQDRARAATLVDELTLPYLERTPAEREAAWVARARAAQSGGKTEAAVAALGQAQAIEPGSLAAAAVALELAAAGDAAGEAALRRHLQAKPDSALRLPYVQTLLQAQRYADASTELQWITRARPDDARGWLALGSLQVELRRSREAMASLQRYLDLVPQGDTAQAAADRDSAFLLMAQAHEQLKDYAQADAWLARVEDDAQAAAVAMRRATLLGRQGRIDEGRALIAALPITPTFEERARLLAEVQFLREMKQWKTAEALLQAALQRSPDDAELMYEQSLAVERLGRFDEMERLLREVIRLKPDNAHAFNALGYSLADRGQRLQEARELIQKALALTPGDAFITDSLAWAEYRLGNLPEAESALRRAWTKRRDTEIGAHFGEVLWAAGKQDEARAIWREVQERDPDNETLRETLQRLRVKL